MESKIKHGPIGELWLYRHDYETNRWGPNIDYSALLKPDPTGNDLLCEVSDLRGAVGSTSPFNNRATYVISPRKLRELIEKHGTKISSTQE